MEAFGGLKGRHRTSTVPLCSQRKSSDFLKHDLIYLSFFHAVIPNKSYCKRNFRFDAKCYKDRNAIERMFGRLKDFRRVATRYDKKAENFMAALCLAAIVCYWI